MRRPELVPRTSLQASSSPPSTAPGPGSILPGDYDACGVKRPSDDRANERDDPAPAAAEAESGAAPDRTGSLDVEFNIGPRVTAVFTAAEKAAQHILTMAREEADDLRRRSEAEAESLLSQRRYQAEEEAARRLAEAQAQADAIRQAAEDEAHEIEGSARRQEYRVREEARLMEERVEWAREGLREAAERLREVQPDGGFVPAASSLPVPDQTTDEHARPRPEESAGPER